MTYFVPLTHLISVFLGGATAGALITAYWLGRKRG